MYSSIPLSYPSPPLFILISDTRREWYPSPSLASPPPSTVPSILSASMSNEKNEDLMDENKNEEGDDDKKDKRKRDKEKDKERVEKVIERIHDELEDQECYHGQLLEEEVKGILPRRGDFILRTQLNAGGSKDIYATINWNDEILNIQMKAKQGKGDGILIYSFDNKTKGSAIKDLLQKHMCGVAVQYEKNAVMLLNPIAKQAWELRLESVEKVKKLGEGAFGEVHSGRLKLRMGKFINVAIKVIKKTANNEKATTELQKEGALMRKFAHPNVVRTYGMVIERDTIMVVMELVNGGGLNDYVKKNTISMEEKGNYALDIANGLTYIHNLNCIHRDIACRNCLIDVSKKQAKVSDFGLTRQTEVYKIQPNERIPIRWIAPEVLKTYEYTRAADIYAFGILVWEIFADGATPFGTLTNQQIKEGIQGTLRPEWPPGTPPDVVETINNCWSGDPRARLQLSEVKKAFGKFKMVFSEAADKTPQMGAPIDPIVGGGNGGKKKKEESVKRKSNASMKSRPKSKDKIVGKSTRK